MQKRKHSLHVGRLSEITLKLAKNNDPLGRNQRIEGYQFYILFMETGTHQRRAYGFVFLISPSPEKEADVFLEEITPSQEKTMQDDLPYPLNISVRLHIPVHI